MRTRIIGNRSDITGETNQYYNPPPSRGGEEYQVDNTRIGLSQIPDTLEDKYLNSQLSKEANTLKLSVTTFMLPNKQLS